MCVDTHTHNTHTHSHNTKRELQTNLNIRLPSLLATHSEFEVEQRKKEWKTTLYGLL
jgi:hypothetical protein